MAGPKAPMEFLLRSTRVLACCSGPEMNLDARNVLGTPYPLPGAVRERAPHQPRFDSGSEMGRLPCVESAVPCVPPSGLVHAGAVMDRHPAGPMQIVPRYPAAPFDPHGPCLSLLSSVKGAERPAQFGGIDGLDSLAVYATHEIALCPKLAAAPLAVLFRQTLAFLEELLQLRVFAGLRALARFALKEHAENIINLLDCLPRLSAFKQVMMRPQLPPVRLTLCLRNRQLLEDPFNPYTPIYSGSGACCGSCKGE